MQPDAASSTSCANVYTAYLGAIPYRMALAGGWIDQPFVSRLNPNPPGSMVVVQIHPTTEFTHRSGMATGTRKVAQRLWGSRIPNRPCEQLVRELYEEENRHLDAPSGSQDMIGLIYPGISRLDYDFSHEGGLFPRHIESCNDGDVARWLESVIQVIPIGQRPPGYSPLGEQDLRPEWVARLGQTGKECYDAITRRDLAALGASMNQCMRCWEELLPHTVRHPLIDLDLRLILSQFQKQHAGAMFSGCGGGYLYVASQRPIPGAIRVRIRSYDK